jgi:hypothetical protein
MWMKVRRESWPPQTLSLAFTEEEERFVAKVEENPGEKPRKNLHFQTGQIPPISDRSPQLPAMEPTSASEA